ncbi:putative arabinosyltransferase ARAD1 [Silene latifolia]|uniref:putative arabinosyltransferase ARAD1 n=1 Tax=Silene latifolia TaxID=37657 RepID=UPI003D782117
MAERNSSLSLSILRRASSLFCWFSITSLILLVSCFFVLRSPWRPSLSNHIVSNVVGYSNPNVGVFRGECSAGNKHVLKVFMYDLPPEFHFGILDWKPQGSSVWPDIRKTVPHYPGGLNLQHSIEHWLTLDLLFSQHSGNNSSRIALRVHNSSEADVVFVPFFSSLSYNRFSRVKKEEKISRDKLMQDRLVKYLEAQEEWKRSGGVDHIILAHHPNSLSYARNQLWPAIFVLSDFGRYPLNLANVNKDIIAPYRHVIKSFDNDTSTFDSRTILLYFQGAIHRKDGGVIRQELFNRLKDEKDVHFAFGSVQHGGINNATLGMHSSKFCLNIAGDTPSSNRLFDAIASHCVPVIISDDIELPFEDVIDYSEFSIFVSNSDAVKEKFLINLINGIKREEWTRMWNKLQQVKRYFEFRYPSRDNDAVQMIWRTVAHKVPAIKLKLHRSRRFSHSTEARDPLQFMVSRNFW